MQPQKITKFVKTPETDKKWFVIDAGGKVLGRLASQVAHILRGKHKPEFTPNMDNGDFVVVVNAEKVKVTGNREDLKTYFRYSGYPGGDKYISYKEMQKKNPEYIIHHAVGGMLPHNKLGRKIRKKLKVYSGASHPHEAQKPVELEID